jgi:UDP-2,3-diacylglucosamine pyrophosphatase LpxH
VHGDYFDIYKIRKVVPAQAIYGVYEGIYHGDKSTVLALERYFYNPVMLLIKWIELYKKNPEVAKKQQIASELRTFMNLDSPQEIRKLEKGVRYLNANRATGASLLIPASSRPQLSADLRKRTSTPRSKQKKLRKTLVVPESNLPVRNLLTKRSPFELAKEISNNSDITRVIFGHTHLAVNKASEHWWNTGCWVDNVSTFIEIEDEDVHLYRFKDGNVDEIPET